MEYKIIESHSDITSSGVDVVVNVEYSDGTKKELRFDPATLKIDILKGIEASVPVVDETIEASKAVAEAKVAELSEEVNKSVSIAVEK